MEKSYTLMDIVSIALWDRRKKAIEAAEIYLKVKAEYGREGKITQLWAGVFRDAMDEYKGLKRMYREMPDGAAFMTW